MCNVGTTLAWMLVKKEVKLKDKNVAITFVPQDSEDLWYIYNLLAKGDTVQLSTSRNVKKGPQNQIQKGKSKMEKVNVRLKLVVEDIDYVALDLGMRVSGRSIEQNEHVPLNSYHTAEVELNKDLIVLKENWDLYDKSVLEKLCSVELKADIGAVVLEDGVAHICYVTESMTVMKTKVEKSIPRKNSQYGTRELDKARETFLTMVMEAMIRHFDFDKLKVILLASPGFLAKSLYDKLMRESTNLLTSSAAGDKVYVSIVKNKSKFVVAHASTGYLQGLEEALAEPATRKRLSDTQYSAEQDALDQFHQALNLDDDRACYGFEEVQKAINLEAVRNIMISDTLFRSDDINTRRSYIELLEQAKRTGAKLFVFSSLHELGVQLNQLTGVAALLKYPCPEIYDSDEE